MDAIVPVAERAAHGSWRTRSTGAPRSRATAASPTFWGRSERVVVTSGLSKAFAMPGLRIGWAVGPEAFVRDFWERHDYTTLTPGMVSDVLCAAAMEPARRAAILARTRGDHPVRSSPGSRSGSARTTTSSGTRGPWPERSHT